MFDLRIVVIYNKEDGDGAKMTRGPDFIKSTKETLAKRAGQICSNPECGRFTSGPHTEQDKAINLGEAAHIKAARKGQARYDPNMTDEERRDISNGIWLCKECARKIDLDETKFTVDLLNRWKKEHEDYIAAGKSSKKNRKDLPQLSIRLYKMGRDQSKHEEISFDPQDKFPQNFQFGISLENTTEATLAKGIRVTIQLSWRGNDLFGKAPSFEAPNHNGWKTQVGDLVCEQSAVLIFQDLNQPCFHSQPIDWDNARFTIFERMKGYIEVVYNISSIEPHVDNSGELRIILG